MTIVSFNEVAKLYFPLQQTKSATNSLGRWIRRCPQLYQELIELGMKDRLRFFTPRMIERVYFHLGEP